MTFDAASTLDGTYPRPQLVREQWCDLGGEWAFAYDDADAGVREAWFGDDDAGRFDRTIVVPFPPESPASGIGDTGFHPVVWYRRELTAADLAAAGHGASTRLMLNFGAVDYRATVWVGGMLAGTHEGGGSPFSLDVTELVRGDAAGSTYGVAVVLRAEDDPADLSQPRGKQDWHLEPHAIWYHRTTGIWQPVWLEAVPEVAIERIHWTPDLVNASVGARVRFTRPAPEGAELSIGLTFEGRALGSVLLPASGRSVEVVVPLPEQRNGQAYEHLLWSPEHPRLVDAEVTLSAGGASGADVVHSYLGLRSAAVASGRFLLNDRPYYVRSVLNQGYWPESHLAAPSVDGLRAEAQLIKDLGFNAARLHQKFEDPRFLFFADTLGLLIWGESPAAYEFTPTAVNRMTREWTDIVDRDYSHPSIVTWVPTNESWGVQHLAHDARMRDYAAALVRLTKALDPTRPVISNDGWEHVNSDILSVHDYESSGPVVAARYGTASAIDALFDGLGPAGRRMLVEGTRDTSAPVMLTEFGGVSFVDRAHEVDGAWGYSAASSAEDFGDRVGALVEATLASPVLAGFCYTQLADTGQETNGLVTDDRRPKLPIERLRAIIAGPRA
ncbi:glycoside hydrolase family 2 protein [Leifsonia poae]|uniref:Beta-galactosidase n=1 Tax=Leifsonia poae TaxID=110933 RepID=A0A9W6LZX0_9MICO|nr:glycoside hydrolase family 2 TIM barrel-domain containing protein [Leifsonia poae]GLJ76723.1 beta-galactosidase [Leifsonia poae]